MTARTSQTANDQSIPERIVQNVFEVGKRLHNGTIILHIDPEEGITTLIPEGIFVGKGKYDDIVSMVRGANRNALHGHRDWEAIKNFEAYTLQENWGRVAPKELQGRKLYKFWIAALYDNDNGLTRTGGKNREWGSSNRSNQHWIPAVRLVPTHSLEI